MAPIGTRKRDNDTQSKETMNTSNTTKSSNGISNNDDRPTPYTTSTSTSTSSKTNTSNKTSTTTGFRIPAAPFIVTVVLTIICYTQFRDLSSQLPMLLVQSSGSDLRSITASMNDATTSSEIWSASNFITSITTASISKTTTETWGEENEPMPIAELVGLQTGAKRNELSCPNGLIPVYDTHLDRSITHSNRKIPKVVHMTSKSRCVHAKFAYNIEKWRFPNHSFYFHDDEAVDRMLYQINHTLVDPGLKEVFSCLTNGASKADVWRLLIMYYYGGTYSDIDNVRALLNESTVSATYDAFFVVEAVGIPSQYYMAISKGHPLMVFCLQYANMKLRGTPNVMLNNPAQNTGPKALKIGLIQFLTAGGDTTNRAYLQPGTYTGANNRTVTVLGTKENPVEYVKRSIVSSRFKSSLYASMNMTHFSAVRTLPRKGRISCSEHLIRANGTKKVANYRYTGQGYVEVVKDEHK